MFAGCAGFARGFKGFCLLLALGACAAPPPPPPVSTSALEAARARLTAVYAGWFDADGLRRPDGHAYTVDVAHLLEHAARLGDAGLYARVHAVAVRLVMDDPADPYTAGFVAWRSFDDRPDASGTTEALHLARALRVGAARLGRPADAALAARLLDGYARHAYVDRGVWLIRNYFAFQTRAFANDSYLVDYEPDLLAEAGLAALARRSTAVVVAAWRPVGLVDTLLQPDLGTVMPDLPVGPFSPNDVIQLNNACAVALGAAGEAPAVAWSVLRFGAARWAGLRRYYLGRDGAPAHPVAADLSTRTCLLRLALRLGHAESVAAWLPALLPAWEALPADRERRLHTLGEVLLTLDALIEARQAPSDATSAR